ncbi:MAG: AmmeMemoRadiSam system protein A, partial [Alphaproteobacteria bacterium]|nr:AmmeMemoRadiSam system protein A [Alphaproteobacteria bacterium]
GDATDEDVAQVLERAWGGPETLIVVSSDLSHYLPYDQARALDAATCTAIERLDGDAIGRDQACGRVPVKGLLALARHKGLSVRTADLRNSGDTAGPRDQVVGYGAWLFFEGETRTAVKGGGRLGAAAELLKRHGKDLLALAASSIDHGLDHGRPISLRLDTVPGELREHGAAFVTLKKNGALRGCIGSPEAHRPLATDVTENAFRAAFHDPRFPKLTAAERPALNLSVSVLTKPEPMSFESEADLLAQLRPGQDGLIIASGGRRALFLPSVWEQLPQAESFLAHLKAKAGFAPGDWPGDMHALRFAAAEIKGRAD